MASGSLVIGGMPIQGAMTYQQYPSVQPMVMQAQPQPMTLQGVVQQAAVQQVPVIPATVSGGVIQPVALNSSSLQPVAPATQVTIQPAGTMQPLVINTAALQPPQVYAQQFMDPYAYSGYPDPYQDGYYQDYPQYDDGYDYGYDDYGNQDYYDDYDYGDEGYDYMPEAPQPQPIIITNNNDNSRGFPAGGNRGPIIVKMNQNKKKPRPRPRPRPPAANDCQPSYTIIKKVVREKVGKSRRSKHDSDSDEERGGLSSADLKILRKLKL